MPDPVRPHRYGQEDRGDAGGPGSAPATARRWNARWPPGELPAGADLDEPADRLVGPVYHRVPVTGQPVTSTVVDGLIRACTPGPSAGS
ncbi:hypothetical protein [Actinoplanes sp. N902-109]|uniref:hypothetical protein n=1 Tax=Actinoplanes sp. (strain N902-109) TaxID=649831 RepID=UPI0003A44755|nr:hypothetical protein [Actinoplanes sp. N902-109]